MNQRVYVVSYGEDGEGSTVTAVTDNLKAARAAGDRHVATRGLAHQQWSWFRETTTCWTRRYSSCDTVTVQRWQVTT